MFNLKVTRKRGLSGVVTSLILVVIVFAAVTIVWVVIKNVVMEQTENFATTDIRLSLEIKNVVDGENNISVRVKRGVGDGDITGLLFVVSDGINAKTIKEENVNLDKFEEKTYNLNYVGWVKEISVAPLFTTESGKEKKGPEGAKFKANFIGLDVLEDAGLISWWRMDGNADDKMGLNDGVENGVVVMNLTGGKYGGAYEFDGDANNFINISDSPSLNPTKAITVSMWIKPNVMENWINPLMKSTDWITQGYGFLTQTNRLKFFVRHMDFGAAVLDPSPSAGEWYHLVGTYDGSEVKIYVEGVERDSNTYSSKIPPSSANLFIGGNFNGTIDEVMIFSKALNKEEVKELYESDLS